MTDKEERGPDKPPESRSTEAGKGGCTAFVVALGVMVLFDRVTGTSASWTLLLVAFAVGLVTAAVLYLRKPSSRHEAP